MFSSYMQDTIITRKYITSKAMPSLRVRRQLLIAIAATRSTTVDSSVIAEYVNPELQL